MNSPRRHPPLHLIVAGIAGLVGICVVFALGMVFQRLLLAPSTPSQTDNRIADEQTSPQNDSNHIGNLDVDQSTEKESQVSPLTDASPTIARTPLRYRWPLDEEPEYTCSLQVEFPNKQVKATGNFSYTAEKTTAVQLEKYRSRQAPIAEHIGTGTGFLVTTEGHLITNAHVVEGAEKIEVRVGNRFVAATPVDVDWDHDLALLAFDQPPHAVPLQLAHSEQVQVAEDLSVIGFPLSDVLGESSATFTRGIVSRVFQEDTRQILQTDAAINHGNSGGPILNDRGAVIAVATSKLTGSAVSNVGLGVSVAHVRDLLAANELTFSDTDASPMPPTEVASHGMAATFLLRVTPGLRGLGATDFYTLQYEANMEIPRAMLSGYARNLSQIDHGELLVDELGRVYRDSDSIQLPYLLGPIGRLVLNPFPLGARSRWETRRAVQVGWGLTTRDFRFEASNMGKKNAEERIEYQILEENGSQVKISRTYGLRSESGGGIPSIELELQGEGIFDRKLGRWKSFQQEGTFRSNRETSEVKLHLEFHAAPGRVQKTLPTDMLTGLFSDKTIKSLSATDGTTRAAGVDALQREVSAQFARKQLNGDSLTQAIKRHAIAVRFLVAAMEDHDPRVRVAVENGWQQLLSKQATTPVANESFDLMTLAIIRGIEDAGIQRTERTLALLNKLGPRARAAVPLLTEIVANHEELSLRVQSAKMLCMIGPAATESLPTIRHLIQNRLASGDNGSANGIVAELPRFGPPAVDLLIALAADQQVGKQACDGLSQLGGVATDAVAPLVSMVEIEHSPNRVAALFALASICGYPDPSGFGSYLKQEAALKRAAENRNHIAELNTALITAITDDDLGMQNAAVRCLGFMGDDAAPLAVRIAAEADRVQPDCVGGLFPILKQLDAQSADKFAATVAPSYAKALPYHAAMNALMHLGEPAITPQLLSRLNDENDFAVHSTIVTIILHHRATPTGGKVSVTLLANSERSVREHVRNTLASDGAQGACYPLLLVGIKASDAEIREACIKTIPVVLESATTPDNDRSRLCQEATAALNSLRQDSNSDVRRVVEDTLNRIAQLQSSP
ncbi:trypsin-like peptidase domain-containing protein [Bremerella sp. P1]|uniref:trypsin-like peptidase domain-containing protein n=1 Tax=Bremerella sp. P1 TaxID=3026424 RepID=UPI0023674E91|nr:trypsin-like peptidase domain-containing protein [Bremerella sp. P1]WDI40557.1 trypsin-like peptidase domain-containing protein [Bremerella sp. P1]